MYGLLQDLYEVRLQRLRREVMDQKRRVRVAFLIMYGSDTQLFPVLRQMLSDARFEPMIVLNPDVSRGWDHAVEIYNRTKRELEDAFGPKLVLDGFDFEHWKGVDFTGRFDLMATNNPYDHMAAEEFKIVYWARRCVPSFYTSYFYMGRCHVTLDNLRLHELSCLWRFYLENEYVRQLSEKYRPAGASNCCVVGYPKMDALYGALQHAGRRERKLVIYAPHHSIWDADTAVGAFLDCAEEFLSVVSEFKDVDFVFRPHPLLFAELKKSEWWGAERVHAYMDRLLEHPNVSYSTCGDYCELFAESSALIHDCGSFSAEYLYVGRPCAYVWRKGLSVEKTFTEFGLDCLRQHYDIRNPGDMREFVRNVVVAGADPKAGQRADFVKKNLLQHYPFATRELVNDIKSNLGLE